MDDTSVPRRTLLTDAQRAALLAIPTDETTLIRHYTLSDEDRRLIIRRRRPDTRLGLALQLCALRYPGRLLRPGEPIPMEAAGFIAGQLDVSSEALGDFARRTPTRYEQLGALRQTYGFVDLTHPHRQELRGWLLEVALVTTDGVAVVAALAEEMRRRRIVVPGVTVLERLAAEVISTADNQVIKSIVGRLRLEQRRRLDVLCDQKAHERQSRFSWVREPPGVAGVTSFHALVDRLEAVRGIMLDPVIVADTPPARLRRLAREGRRYSAQALRKMSPPRRYAVLAATLLEVERDLTDAAVEMVDVLLGRALAAAKRRREEALAREADLRRDTFRLLVRLGEELVAAHEQGGDLGCAVTRVTDWEHLNAVIDAAGGFVRADEADAIGMLGAEHSAVRRWAPWFLEAFRFDGAPSSRSLLRAVALLRDAYLSKLRMLIEYSRSEPPAGMMTGWWRGVGVTHNSFPVESFIDEMAEAAGKDPVEFRRLLLAESPRAKAVLDLAAEKAGWGTPMPAGKGRGVSVILLFGTYAAQVAEVSVDAQGEVRLDRVVCAVDCGRVVNPDGAKAQMEGGIIFGASAALYNAIDIEKGRIVQTNFDTYRVMRIDEAPTIEVYFVDSDQPPTGTGEPGTAAIAGAIGNAVSAATGKRLRKLPVDRGAINT